VSSGDAAGGLEHLCLMSTHAADWPLFERAWLSHRRFTTLGLGLHPWFVESAPPGWADQLEDRLRAHPTALVGEIGLDRARATATSPAYAAQLVAFRLQLRCAARLRRPVSIHCVRAYGDLLRELRNLAPPQSDGSPTHRTADAADPFPPALAIHSYAGSPETADALLALPRGLGGRIYFGLSVQVSCRSAAKMAATLPHLPVDRLLLESDAEEPGLAAGRVAQACAAVAAAKGWHEYRVAAVTRQNAWRFLAIGGGHGQGECALCA
jgi:TatD DNase family protein